MVVDEERNELAGETRGHRRNLLLLHMRVDWLALLAHPIFQVINH